MTPNLRKEQFSIAYVRAVAAAAGFKVDCQEIDDESVDLTIARSGGSGTVRSPRCDVQLKCTAQGALGEELCVHFELKLKNYDDLRHADVLVPRILVVMLVPSDEVSDWLSQDETALCLHRCAYWQTLRGRPETANKASVTIEIPRANVFDAPGLEGIMNRIGQGGVP